VPPVTKNGVSPSCIALPIGEWRTIADFLVIQFPNITRAEWLARMDRGDVIDEHGNRVLPDRHYQAHIKIYYYRSLPAERSIPFEESVLYQDEYIVVADKPHFLPVTPAGRYVQETLLVRLKQKLQIDTLAPMHRIDRETAGVVLFTIQPKTRDRYHAIFRDRAVTKHYEAIAPWRPDLIFPITYRSRLVTSDSFMKMCESPGEPNAETIIHLLEVKGDAARYGLQPTTGQRHQLRVQMAALGMPLMNDRIYPHHYPEFSGNDADIAREYNQPLKLLAKSLSFVDPITGQLRQFTSAKNLEF
jgi:tRNA pseudouridine32 synthase/23S rRNA pseudouridine746 synthase